MQLELKRKVSHDGKDFTHIEIDEPTIGAIEAYEASKARGESDTSAMVHMLAVDSGLPIEAIRKIRTSDMLRIAEGIAPFVPAAPPIGGAGSGI